MNNLKDYIKVIPNAISEKLCNDIFLEYLNCNDWLDAGIANKGVNKHVRNCQIIGLSNQKLETRKNLDNQIFQSVGNVINQYKNEYKFLNLLEDTGYELLKYETGGFYKTHVDSYNENPRTIALSFCLNDNYLGGEFSFFNRELNYKLEEGSAIAFPSNFMYPHEILPVTAGTRYSIITWLK